MILFVDFDGVLHRWPRDSLSLHFCCAPHMWELLRRHPEIKCFFQQDCATRTNSKS